MSQFLCYCLISAWYLNSLVILPPAILHMLCCIYVKESPKYLAHKHGHRSMNNDLFESIEFYSAKGDQNETYIPSK